MLLAGRPNFAPRKSRIERALERRGSIDALDQDQIIVLPLEAGCGKVRSAGAAQPPVDLVALKVHQRGGVALGPNLNAGCLREIVEDLSLGSGGLFRGLPTVLVPHQPVDGAKRQDRKGKADNRERLDGRDLNDDEFSCNGEKCNEDYGPQLNDTFFAVKDAQNRT